MAAERSRRRPSPLQVGIFGEAPLIALAGLVWFTAHGGGSDFAIFRRAGEAVLNGHSPYVKPSLLALAQNNRFVYPMPFAYLFVPFTFVSARTGAIIFLLLSAGAILVSLRLLGVTDWRVYGLALIGLPVFSSLGLGTVGPLLLLLLAIGWRFRGSPWSGVALALAAAAKLFLWPVLVWLVARRYYRATAAAAITLAAIVAVWAAADPTGLSRYPETVRLLNIVQRWKSYSLQTLWFRFGLPAPVLVAIVLAVLGALLVVFTRSSRRSFALAVVVSVLASPILWVHYYVLLLAPLALARPRLGPMWIVPFALWVTPHPESSGSVWKIAVVLVAGVAIALLDPDAPVRTDSARAKVRRVTPRWVAATLRD